MYQQRSTEHLESGLEHLSIGVFYMTSVFLSENSWSSHLKKLFFFVLELVIQLI
jgi:hypothetical protein